MFVPNHDSIPLLFIFSVWFQLQRPPLSITSFTHHLLALHKRDNMDSLSDFFLRTNASIAPPLPNWLEMPEIPLAGELMDSDSPQLPLNEFETRPQLREQYFETQYRLNRYEATETLRRAIHVIRRAVLNLPPSSQDDDHDMASKLENVNVYSKVISPSSDILDIF